MALRDTIRLMGEIDEIIPSWPTKGRPTGMCASSASGAWQHHRGPVLTQFRSVLQGLTPIHNCGITGA